MLYPTYLSSYRNLLKKDITPISLMNVFMGDRSKKPNVSKQEPVPPPEQPIKATPKLSATSYRHVSGPITISDRQTTAVMREMEDIPNIPAKEAGIAKNSVNPVIGCFGRYSWMLFLERAVQLIAFPLVVKDKRSLSLGTSFCKGS